MYADFTLHLFIGDAIVKDVILPALHQEMEFITTVSGVFAVQLYNMS